MLFTGLDLVVAPGDVVGLVGANGAGKSTLLAHPGRPARARRRAPSPLAARRATVGLPAAGARAAAGRDRARLPRAPHGRGGGAARTLDAATQALAAGRRRRRRRLRRTRSSAGSRWAAPTSRSAPRASPPTWASTSSSSAPMTALSGGQAARASLASLLLSRYDLFLLDEPTNDLDLDGLERLERFVRELRARHRARQPRPRVPGPHRRPRAGARPRAAAGQPSSAAATRRTSSSARSRGGTRARPTRSTPTRARRCWRGRACSGRGWRRASATRAARPPDRDKSLRALPRRVDREAGVEGAADGAAARAPGGRRGAAARVGAAHVDRRGAALGRRRRHACASAVVRPRRRSRSAP